MTWVFCHLQNGFSRELLSLNPIQTVIETENAGLLGTTHQPFKGNWHERAAFQRSAFGRRSTASNDVVATIFIILTNQFG